MKRPYPVAPHFFERIACLCLPKQFFKRSCSKIKGGMLNRIIVPGSISIFVLAQSSGRAQTGPASGLYRIVSGTYAACCGFAGEFRQALPNESQGFISL